MTSSATKLSNEDVKDRIKGAFPQGNGDQLWIRLHQQRLHPLAHWSSTLAPLLASIDEHGQLTRLPKHLLDEVVQVWLQPAYNRNDTPSLAELHQCATALSMRLTLQNKTQVDWDALTTDEQHLVKHSLLFEPHADDTRLYTFRVPTVGHFLAAYGLHQKHLSTEQLVSLFIADPHGLRPQWTDLAVWLVEFEGQNLWRAFMQEDPLVGLNCFDHQWTPEDRRDLLQNLLRSLKWIPESSIAHGPLWRLKHTALADTLRPIVLDMEADFVARRISLDIIGACQCHELQEELLKLALDPQLPEPLGRTAVHSLSQIATPAFIPELMQLLDLPAHLDPHDEKKGVALKTLWKRGGWSLVDILPHLSQPKDERFFGSYRQLIDTDIISEIEFSNNGTDALHWFQWVAQFRGTKSRSFRAEYHGQRMFLRAVQAAIKHTERQTLLPKLANALAPFIKAGRSNWYHNLQENVFKTSSLHFQLIAWLDPLLRDSPEDIIASTLHRLGWFDRSSVPRLLELAQETPPSPLKTTYIELAAACASINDALSFDLLVQTFNKDPKTYHALGRLVRVDLDSPLAHKLKEHYKRWSLPPTTPAPEQNTKRPDHRPCVELEDALTATPPNHAWFMTLAALHKQSQNGIDSSLIHKPVSQSTLWPTLSPGDQNAVQALALQCIQYTELTTKDWNSDDGSIAGPAFLAVKAFDLLLDTDLERLKALSASTWTLWAEPLLRHLPDALIPPSIGFIAKHAQTTLVDRLIVLQENAKHSFDLEVLANGLLQLPWDDWGHFVAPIIDLNKFTRGHISLAQAMFEHLPQARAEAWSILTHTTPHTTDHIERDGFLLIALLKSDFNAQWPQAFQHIQEHPALAPKVLLQGYPKALNTKLDVESLELLWRWMVLQYPPAKDPTLGGLVTERHDLGRLRASIPNILVEKGTHEALKTLRRLWKDHPNNEHGFRWQVARATLRLMERSFVPVTPVALDKLAQHREKAWVSTRRGLLRFAKQRTQDWLNKPHTKTLLWERVENDRFTPVKSARWIGLLYRQLADAFQARTVPSEVQLTRNGPTIALSAATTTPYPLDVTLEVMANWDPMLLEALEQPPAYPNPTTSHIWVGCFSGRAWTQRHDHERRCQSARHDLQTLQNRYKNSSPNTDLWLMDVSFNESAQDMCDHLSFGHALMEAFKASAVTVRDIHSVGSSKRWEMECSLPDTLREPFGLSANVMCLATDENHVGRNAADHVRAEAQQSDRLIDRDLLLLPRPANATSALQSEVLAGYFQQPVIWSPERSQTLHESMWQSLPKADIFAWRKVCRGTQVFGRTQAITKLTRRIQGGHSVGIFGLRKVGKTTLARAVTDHIDPLSASLELSHRAIPATCNTRVFFMDMQSVQSGTQEQLIALFWRSIHKRLRAEGRQLPKHAPNGWDTIHETLTDLLSEPESRVCVCIDEFDYLFVAERNMTPIQGANRFFGLLRELSQTTDRLSTVVIGREPSVLDKPELNGVPNPVLGWFHPEYINGFERADADDMMRTLGLRVGLDLGQDSLQTAWDLSGGHPSIIRQFGSALFDATHHLTHRTTAQDTDPWLERALDIFYDYKTLGSDTIPREVTALLSNHYPESWAILLEYIHTAPQPIMTRSQWRSPHTRTLRRFGILQGDRTSPSVPQAITEHIRYNHPPNTNTYSRAHA